jgi:hypothetical protein
MVLDPEPRTYARLGGQHLQQHFSKFPAILAPGLWSAQLRNFVTFLSVDLRLSHHRRHGFRKSQDTGQQSDALRPESRGTEGSKWYALKMGGIPFPANGCQAVMNLTEMESKVREATNGDPWGASASLMQEIAQGTHNYQQLNEIMPMIYKRFTDKTAEEWRQIYKVSPHRS